jgi:germination protein M
MRDKKMAIKRTILLVLALCLLLSGCGVIRDKHTAGAEVPVSELNTSGLEYYGRVEKSAIYFYNETSQTLMAELRTLVVDQDTNPAAVAIRELLKGPSNTSLKGVAPDGMTLDFLEYSKDVANVYLKYSGEALEAQQAYILEQAISNTVTDILGQVSVCVFYNGIRAGLAGYPSAPLKKQTGNILDAWTSAKSKYAPENTAVDTETVTGQNAVTAGNEEEKPKTNEIATVLYFVSAGGKFILPEVRTVKYTGDQYIEALIQELKNGPRNTTAMKSPLVADVEPKQIEFKDLGNGKRALELYFSRNPVQTGYAVPSTLVSYAALIYTITGFMPGVQAVDIYVAGKHINTVEDSWFYGGMRRSDYVGYIGSSAPVYFGDKSSDLLLEVQRSMEQGKTWSARARVLELLKGPLEEDGDNVWPVMPPGVTADDILSVDVYNDIVFVDLSTNFKEACAGLSARSEMLLVYSIVNTITAMDGVNKVQFTVEGKQVDKLAGYLCLSDPFLRNYGIIKSG